MFEEKKVGKMLMENRLENVREMLSGNDNLRFFYLIILAFVFQDYRTFEIRNDLIDPGQDIDGDVIVCDDGNVIYFKHQEDELTDFEFESILDVCYKLQDRCGGDIDAYVLCSPEIDFRGYDGIEREGISIKLASLKSFDGDRVVGMLNRKRKNKEQFTIVDHVFHLLLPYMNCADKKEYIYKVQSYMFETMLDNAEERGVEIVRF